MGFKTDQQGPCSPRSGTPLRASGSVRRTFHVDHVRDHGATGGATISGAARELATTTDAAEVTGAVHLVGRVHANSNCLEELRVTPSDPRVDRLIGERLGGGFRARIAEHLPDELENRSLLHLLLDDLPGANLVSGYALQRDNAEHCTEFELTEQRLVAMVDICAGWANDASLLRGVRAENMMPTSIGPSAPDLDAPTIRSPGTTWLPSCRHTACADGGESISSLQVRAITSPGRTPNKVDVADLGDLRGTHLGNTTSSPGSTCTSATATSARSVRWVLG